MFNGIKELIISFVFVLLSWPLKLLTGRLSCVDTLEAIPHRGLLWFATTHVVGKAIVKIVKLASRVISCVILSFAYVFDSFNGCIIVLGF